jgi:hypothetical protein
MNIVIISRHILLKVNKDDDINTSERSKIKRHDDINTSERTLSDNTQLDNNSISIGGIVALYEVGLYWIFLQILHEQVST